MTDFRFQRTFGPKPNYPGVIAYDDKGRYQSGPIVIAGPCSIESEDQVTQIAIGLNRVGCTFMRGGVFRAGTYPPEDFGLRIDLLEMWKAIANRYDLKIIVEVIDVRQIELLDEYADAFQVGARQAQGYVLLKEISQTEKHVTLKRGAGMKLDEFLGAAEYLTRGRCTPILIERGSATQMNHVRWDLSISIIPAIKAITKIPIIADASHGTGRRDLVYDMTLAGVQAGADGYLLEVHPDPDKSLSDSDQAYPLHLYQELHEEANYLYWRRRGINIV